MPNSMKSPALAPADLAELLQKYEVMLRLRRDDTAGLAGDPRPAMLELARRFPGSLRQLDELPFEVLEERSLALATATADPSRALPWMQACAIFHRLMRGALAAKRWLRGRKEVDEGMADAFRHALPEMGEDAGAWVELLPTLARPPGRRVSDLVLSRTAATMGIAAEEAKRLIFGPARRLRARP